MTGGSSADRLQPLLARRSVSPRRLCEPGPAADEIAAAVAAGLRAPDHGGLSPWRVVVVERAQRPALARLFVDEKRRRDPSASPEELARASAHAIDVPTLLAFVVGPRADAAVPEHEQWLAAGAALMNVLNAFELLGFGAILLSGERCADAVLRTALGVRADEVLAGFVSIGSVVLRPPAAAPKAVERVLSVWPGDVRTSDVAVEDRALG